MAERAALIYDTVLSGLPRGVHGVEGPARRLLYVLDDLEIQLQVSPDPHPQRVRLFGQLYAGGLPLGSARVRADGAEQQHHGITGRDGDFRFSDLPTGQYMLALSHGGKVICLDPLDLARGYSSS